MLLPAILLIAGLFLHDAIGRNTFPFAPYGEGLFDPDLQIPLLLALLIIKPIVTFAYTTAVKRHADPERPLTPARYKRLQLAARVFTFFTLTIYAADLYLGLLLLTRNTLGDLVLIDELVLIIPPLLMLIAAQSAAYPVERRLHEAALIGMIDRCEPVLAFPRKNVWLLARIRADLALGLVPLLLICTWIETAPHLLRTFQYPLPQNILHNIHSDIPHDLFRTLLGFIATAPAPGLTHDGPQNNHPLTLFTTAGLILIFLLSPALIRPLLGTQKLHDTPTRSRLLALCKTHRVRIPQSHLQVWNATAVNAAVLGFFSPLRYILLSRGLLERLPADQIDAVMAHEIAHIKRGHQSKLILIGGASLGVIGLLTESLNFDPTDNLPLAATLFAPWALAMLWVLRRMERQADTFAVCHIARANNLKTIDEQAAHTVRAALARVAALNNSSPTRRSWRHGSIQSRRDYLQTLVGQPLDNLPIDRLIRRLNLLALAALLTLAALTATRFF